MQKKSSVRFVCIGDLVADYYYNDKQLTNVDGGRSKFNDLANLGKMGNNCVTFSACSNSKIGEMLCIGLKQCNVDITYVQRLNIPSRIYNLVKEKNGTYRCTKKCPKCGKSTWYEESFVRYSDIKSLIHQNDVFIFDSIKLEDIENMAQITSHDILLDIGSISYLSKIPPKTLKSILQRKYEIVQLNQKVADYLLEIFKVNSYEQLKNFINSNLIIITLGKKGAYFLTKAFSCSKSLIFPAKEVDTLGAGDAFFSTFIDEYYKQNKKIGKNFIDYTFNRAIQTTRHIVQSEGGRGQYYKKIKIKEIANTCVCQDFEIQNGR